jgi:hypothetical protein
MVTCASGLLPNPAKVAYFQYKAWWYSIVQKFHNDGKKFQESQFWAYFGLRPWSGLSPKISKLGMMVFYRLEISYWWSKLHSTSNVQLDPVTDQQRTNKKNMLPIFLATWNFIFFKKQINLLNWIFVFDFFNVFVKQIIFLSTVIIFLVRSKIDSQKNSCGFVCSLAEEITQRILLNEPK